RRAMLCTGVPTSTIVEKGMGIGDVISLLWFERSLPRYCIQFIEVKDDNENRLRNQIMFHIYAEKNLMTQMEGMVAPFFFFSRKTDSPIVKRTVSGPILTDFLLARRFIMELILQYRSEALYCLGGIKAASFFEKKNENTAKGAPFRLKARSRYTICLFFKVPMKVLQNMESIRARFFNGADVNSKKPSWVGWKSVLPGKDVGGLGNSLWVRVVKALHGEDGKIGKKVQPRYPSTWLNIINEIESLKLHGIDLVSFITPKLGNGVNSSFWDVAWCGNIAFKNLVPRLYALESMKNIEVTSKLSHGGLKFSFRRNPRGGVEQAQFERLKEMVEGVTLSNSN
nr:RNA-directed DNA polymerase, eukaryota, reverse transcriptase zinc-binding domain protein [Tanacetum cinerariifolium]